MEQVFLICQVPKDSVDWRRSGVPYDMIIVNVKYPIAKNKTKILVHHMDKKKLCPDAIDASELYGFWKRKPNVSSGSMHVNKTKGHKNKQINKIICLVYCWYLTNYSQVLVIWSNNCQLSAKTGYFQNRTNSYSQIVT